MLADITPVILTRDEEPNIARTLGQLTWAGEVVVVDSRSVDRTADIARSFPNVRFVERTFDTIAGQSIHGVAQVHTPWVLLLDADYFVTPELMAELETLQPVDDVTAFEVTFGYAIHGRPLRASLYPPRIVLFRREKLTIWQDGHTPRFRTTEGRTGHLRGKIIHDDRKPLSRFIARQKKYMREEAEKLRSADPHTLNAAARLRKLRVVAPFAVAVYTLLGRRTILDGWPGIYYAFERTLAECILSIELFRRR